MKQARYLTAVASILFIIIGGILNNYKIRIAPILMFTGFAILILGYIPVFILYISKKWDEEDKERNQSNSA